MTDDDTLSPILLTELDPASAAGPSDETLVADLRDLLRPTEMVDRQLQRSSRVPTLASRSSSALLINRPSAENNRGGDSINT